MFNTILYLDEAKFREYKSIFDATSKNAVIKSRCREKKGNIGNTFAGYEEKITDNIEFETSTNYDYFNFENKVKEKFNGEYFFDFTDRDSNNYDINTIPSGAIIKINANINIPEQFGNTKMADDHADLLVHMFNDQPGAEIIDSIIRNRDIKVPIIGCDDDDDSFFMKLNFNNFKINYEELEDIDDDNVIIVGKKIREKSGHIEIFNPYKDFLKIPRSLRKTMPIQTENDSNSISPIFVDKDLIYELEVLAMYR